MIHPNATLVTLILSAHTMGDIHRHLFINMDQCLYFQVNMAHQSGMLFSIIDSRMGSYPSECVERFVGLALKCCEDKPEDRPSILDVVRELENILHILPEIDSKLLESASEYPSKAASFSYLSSTSSTYTTNNPYGSSASNLTSGAISTLTPR